MLHMSLRMIYVSFAITIFYWFVINKSVHNLFTSKSTQISYWSNSELNINCTLQYIIDENKFHIFFSIAFSLLFPDQAIF